MALASSWVPSQDALIRPGSREWIDFLARHRVGTAWSAEEAWAMVRLGMHTSILEADLPNDDWRIAFANAIAHATCGDASKAEAATFVCLKNPQAEPYRIYLAAGIWPYLPTLALQLVEHHPNLYPPVLATLLMKNGKTEKLEEVLTNSLDKIDQAWPELHLVRTNVQGGTPERQLARLNAFLHSYQLAPVRLRDEERPPSSMNIEAKRQVDLVDGPLVSIIMTTFRSGTMTSTAIASILAQSWRNFELIVVDDASGDDTNAIVEEWAKRDPRVRIISLPRNVGTFAAKTIGLQFARGEFITCHDADDWSHPEKIARQTNPLLENNDLIATTSCMVRMQSDGRFYARNVHPLLDWNGSSLLFRRDPVLRSAGAWMTVRNGADYEFSERLALIFGHDKMMRITQPLSFCSHLPSSLMNADADHDVFPGVTGVPQHWTTFFDAWRRWHINAVSTGSLPFVSTDVSISVRNIPVPIDKKNRVDANAVDECLASIATMPS